MAKNDFKSFATAANANVTTQANWETLPALLSGFTAGKASSAQVNKALRQATFIAAALAQYTANKSGQDVLDNGDVAGFIEKMATAFGRDYQALDATLTALAGLATGANKLPYFTGADTAAQTDLTEFARTLLDDQDATTARKTLGAQPLDDTLTALAGLPTGENKLPYFIGLDRAGLADFSNVGRDIAGAGTVNDVLQYLGLGDAAKRNVGTTSGTVAAGDATMGGTYTNVTSSRVMGVTYTNSATRPMLVIFSCDANSFGTAVAAVNGANVARVIGVESSATHNGPSMTFIVPAGATYSITKTLGSLDNMLWAEMV
ncbi:hypothetical protein ACW6AV_000123 [Edwardsiella piscicida]|uniref:hypothetical protein n=1 Tax=Edwardsiella piscicida TaxID=1263550 RepID=UPI00101AC770|nr:hypothetical protein [Edwardsiella piscicida]QBB13752.1 hypothetical protein EVK84_15010 [Edwardsiella piscicida]